MRNAGTTARIAARIGVIAGKTDPTSPAPAPRPAYRDYIGWLAAQPTQDSTAFWQGTLHGFEGSGSLPMLAAPRPGQAVDYLTRGLSFDAEARTATIEGDAPVAVLVQALDGPVLETLSRDGHLLPIYMVLASMSRFRDLIERTNRRRAAAT